MDFTLNPNPTPNPNPNPNPKPNPNQVRLDVASAPQQMKELARDYFDSFSCNAQGEP